MTVRYSVLIIIVLLFSGVLFAQNPSAPPQTDWSAEASRWEGRILETGITAEERGRMYFNAASAMLQAAQQPQAPTAQNSAAAPDFDKMLGYLERAAALSPNLRLKTARNWEIARAMQKQAEQQKDQQNQQNQQQDQKQDQKQNQQQDQKNGQQGQGQQGQGQQSGKQDQSNDISKLQQRQAEQNNQPAGAGAAANQQKLAQDTGAAAQKADKERTRQSLQQAREAMEKAAAALKNGDKDQANKNQQEAMAALEEARQIEKGGKPEDQALRDLAQKEKEYRQLKALLRPQTQEQVEKNW